MSRPARIGHNLTPPNEIGSRNGLWPSVCVVAGTGVQRRSPFFWWRLERKSWAGKGLSRRGLKESAGRFSPLSLSERLLP